jgi:hypothetical protein
MRMILVLLDSHPVFIEHQPLVIRILSWNGNVSLLFDFIYYLHSPKTKGQPTPTQTKILCLIFIQMCNINNYVNLNYKLVNREFGRTNTYIFISLITHSKVYKPSLSTRQLITIISFNSFLRIPLLLTHR